MDYYVENEDFAGIKLVFYYGVFERKVKNILYK
jgi:hypothetical protein